MKKICFILLFTSFMLNGQLFTPIEKLTHQDTLRGSNTSFRDWWNVKKYTLSIVPDFSEQSLAGTNRIKFDIKTVSVMQLDLQEPMQIRYVLTANQDTISFRKEGNFYFLDLKKYFKNNSFNNEIIIQFSGKPHIAQNAPWDGGWIFTKDKNDLPWMTVACQGIGASLWYPCKDYLGDEPEEGMEISIVTERNLKGIANGRFVNQFEVNFGSDRELKEVFTWKVQNPINSYNIVPYVGGYVNFKDTYKGEKGLLTLDYWVLPYNLEKARKQFEQVKLMLQALEYWFGPYPFYEDGYKIVESPHLGMEHQSAIAYGNDYKNGYKGGDISGTGVGLKWDFIIIHESGHEWFGNNITNIDVADMWIHEAFTTYSETLFTEYHYGKELADKYVIGQRASILNDKPIIGIYGVNKEGSVDMYAKGANVIHTLRQIIDNDKIFRNILRGLNKEFYHQTVSSRQIEDYISAKSGINFSKFFDQYLRTVDIPVLEYYFKNNYIFYRWNHVVTGFSYKVKTSFGELKPSGQWKQKKISEKLKNSEFYVDDNYYIKLSKVE
ncbi:M1 family metallopeptidase [Apibacter sp. HY039]|uniref:M1 family metallopeptidase n=1 Tax=Apibacter sp. HY039 TaxID=2501476 RepID=UPI000FEB7408|nr:M1 family metallopeptidase [Apibacter sp. HY039]